MDEAPSGLALLYAADGRAFRSYRMPVERLPSYIRIPVEGGSGSPIHKSIKGFTVRDFYRTWYSVGIPHGGGLVLYYRETGT